MFDEVYEEYVEVPSDLVPFEQRPWMKAAEITDATLAALQRGGLRHGRINYANGDMVGHTGNLDASVIAVEAVDLSLGAHHSRDREARRCAHRHRRPRQLRRDVRSRQEVR